MTKEFPVQQLDAEEQELNESIERGEWVEVKLAEKDAVKTNETIFVFGSNAAGRHGKGAALYARQHHGAIYGQGVGLQGNSYAIPTKNKELFTMSRLSIKKHVDEFIEFANQHPELQFNVTAIGCGLAGYKPEQIAPMFKDVPGNCMLPDEFKQVFERVK